MTSHTSRTSRPVRRSRLLAVVTSAAAAAATLVAADPAHAEDWGLNADRSITYFTSSFGLAAGDGNFANDLYMNDGAATTLISGGKGPGGNGFAFASEDGSHVYFYSHQGIAADDTGSGEDLYVRTPTGTQRITPPGSVTGSVVLMAITPDGSRAWIHTKSTLLPTDTDMASDVYEYRPVSKNLVLLSQGTTGDAFFEAGSTDGTAVWMRTDEALEPNDTDGKIDIYKLEDGAYLRMTPGNGPHPAYFNQLGRTSEALVFTTTESLTNADMDAQPDIYRRFGVNSVELVTTTNAGAAGKPAHFVGADTEGARVVYRTADALVAGDTDTITDVYAAENGFKALMSPGPDDGSVADVVSLNDSAQSVLLRTIGKLLPSDTDLQLDLYVFNDFNSTMTHVNKSNNGFGAVDAMIAPAASVVAFETYEPLSAQDTDATRDVYLHSPLGIQLASRRAADAPMAGPIADDVELHAVLANGHVLFSTSQRLATTDKDDAKDLYEFWSNTLTHVSRDTSPPNTVAEISAPVTEGDMAPVDVRTNEPGTIQCRFGTNPWFTCAHGVNSIGPLAAGTHTLEARATDVAGNVDPTPASVTVVVESAGGGGDTPDLPGPSIPGPPSVPVVPEVPSDDTSSGGTLSAADTLAPRLTGTGLRLRRGVPTLSLTLSEPSSVAVRLQRQVDGRWRTVRTVGRSVAAGSHRIKLARRVGSGKHRALVVATDGARNSSGVLKLALRR